MEKFELLYGVLFSLHKEILEEFPKGWRKKVDDALKKTGLELPQ